MNDNSKINENKTARIESESTIISLHVYGQQNDNADKGEDGQQNNYVLLKEQILVRVGAFLLVDVR